MISALVVLTSLIQAMDNDGENRIENDGEEEFEKRRVQVDAVVKYGGFHLPHFHGGIGALVSQPLILCFTCLLATAVLELMAKNL